METLGEHLRKMREKRKLSMEDVTKTTGITNSRLSRIENNCVKEPSPIMLRELARLYDINIVDVFKRAGYLSDEDFFETDLCRVEMLYEDEIMHIQSQIDFLIKKHN